MYKPVLYLLVVGACGLASAAEPDLAAVERGRSQFVQACGFCHGNDATGNRAPDLIRSPVTNHDENGSTLGPVIRNGRPDKGMPAFPDANIPDLAAFLHAQVNVALSSNDVPHDYPLEKLLTGKASAGEAFFNGAGGCAGCHSPTKDLKGVAGKYKPLDLQSRFLWPGHDLRTAKITLPSGEQVAGKVTHLDEFTISVEDASGWNRSYSRDQVKVEVKDPLDAHRKLLGQYTNQNMHDMFAYLESLK